MSIKAEAVWAPSPSTTRGQPTQLSVDPKGERLAYASNKSIFLRSIDQPSQSTQYTSHTTTTTVARFSPSGYYVASGDISGTVRVWDCVGEGATKGEYPIISGRINDLAWDGDSQRIIAVGDGKEKFGHCITADSGNTVGEISGHSSQINTVSVRQQRPLRAATGSDDTSLAFFHGAPFKFNTSLRRHQRYIYGTAFSPDGTHLVSVGADKKIWLYDGKTGEPKNQIGEGEHTGSIFAVSWAKDSKRFVTSSADQTVKIWDVESGKVVQSWRMGEEGTVSIQDHQVGVVWPTGRSDGLIISLNLAGDLTYLQEGKSKPLRVVQGHQKNITSITPSSDNSADSTFYTGDTNGRICTYDHTGNGETIEGDAHKNYISGLTSSPGRIYSVGWDDALRTIDTSAKTFTGTSTKTDGQPRGVATLSTSTIIATHKGLFILSQNDNSILKQITTPYAPTILAANSSHIAVGGDDSAQHMYDHDLKEIKSIPHPSSVTALSFAPSSSSTPYLAVGFASGKILVYELDNPEPVITRWSSHTGRVTSIDWDAQGARAVSGALDTNIFVWSVKKPGQRVSVGAAHKEGVNGVRWAGEDRVVSVGGDAAVKVWKVEGVE
ncbi:WD40 repeat-like protein [Lecanora helva]